MVVRWLRCTSKNENEEERTKERKNQHWREQRETCFLCVRVAIIANNEQIKRRLLLQIEK